MINETRFVRSQGLKKLKAHGIGVHTPEEIEQFGKNDLKVLSDMLGDKPYFFGDEPTLVSTKIINRYELHCPTIFNFGENT